MLLGLMQFSKSTISYSLTWSFIFTVIFMHYAFAIEVARIFLQTFEEGCRTLAFFLMMNYYIKMTSKLMKKRQWWLKIYKYLWISSIFVFLIVELYVVVEVSKNNITDATLCDSGTYLFLQISNSVLTVAFIVLGYFIDRRVKEQQEA